MKRPTPTCPQCGDPLINHQEIEQNACEQCFEDFAKVDDLPPIDPPLQELRNEQPKATENVTAIEGESHD